MQGEVLAIRAGQDALAIGSAAGMTEEATIRTHLTVCGLTPRQCDLVVLDVQGHSRAEIAAMCGVSPATVKKYWAAIYARLGVESRAMLRAWVRAHLDRARTTTTRVDGWNRPMKYWRRDADAANVPQRLTWQSEPSSSPGEQEERIHTTSRRTQANAFWHISVPGIYPQAMAFQCAIRERIAKRHAPQTPNLSMSRPIMWFIVTFRD
jgi:DNA-binding CsgD family transcriptional regulator